MSDENENPQDVDWSQLEGLGDNPNLPPGVHQEFLTEDMISRRMLWDIAPCADAVAVGAKIGLSAASEDVEDREHQEAHARLAQVTPLTPAIEMFAKHAALAVVGTMIQNAAAMAEGLDLREEDIAETVERLSPVIFVSTSSIIAELLDVGIIHLPHMGFFTTLGE